MAVNLVHQFGRERSRELLEQSFAQFQADKAVVGLARQLRKAEDALEGYAEAATCHLGDFMEYAAAPPPDQRGREGREPVPAVRPSRGGAGVAAQAPPRRRDRRAGREVLGAGGGGRPGDLGRNAAAVRRHRERQARRLAAIDFPTPVEAITRMRIPKNFNGRNPQMRRDLASALRDRTHGLTPPPDREQRRAARSGPERGRDRPRCGPSSGRTRATAAPTARTTPAGASAGSSSTATPRRCGAGWSGAPTPWRGSSTGSATCSPRSSYLDGDTVTDRGRRAEADLLRAGPGRRRVPARRPVGQAAGLGLAAALSVLVFEARRPDDASSPRVPGGPRKEAIGEMVRAVGSAGRPRARPQLDFLRQPDLGLRLVGLPLGRGRRPRRRARRHRARRR